jgi:hypothetical protein
MKKKILYTNYVFDTEETGQHLMAHSMHWLGVVKLERGLQTKFEGRMRPRTGTTYEAEAMKYNGGVTWAEMLTWDEPSIVIPAFCAWIRATLEPGTKALFWSDNNGHDIKWLRFYMDLFGEGDLMGHTSRNINGLFRGFKDGRASVDQPLPPELSSFEKIGHTPHDHTPVNDATRMAEALIILHDTVGFQIDIH